MAVAGLRSNLACRCRRKGDTVVDLKNFNAVSTPADLREFIGVLERAATAIEGVRAAHPPRHPLTLPPTQTADAMH